MAGYVDTLSAWTARLIRHKCSSSSSNAIAFYGREVREPAWLVSARESLMELLQLPPNWDGYGAAPIDQRLAQSALKVLGNVMDEDAPPPSVVPLSDGGIQVEWHRRGRNLEIEFPADRTPSFYYYEDAGGMEREGQVSRSYSQIEKYIASLK